MTSGRVGTFVVGELLVGLDVDRVAEIVAGLPLAPVPLSAPGIAGVANLRGRLLTVFDTRRRLGLHEQPRSADARPVHVIVSAGPELASLLVDRALAVVDLAELPCEQLPDTVSATIRRLTVASYQSGDELLLVLDADALTTDDVPVEAEL